MIRTNINTNTSFFRDYKYKVIIYFQDEVILTEDEYGLRVGDFTESINDGKYQIGNSTIEFNNKNYWASRKFALDAPIGKSAEVYVIIGSDEYILFNGIIDVVNVESEKVKLQLVA